MKNIMTAIIGLWDANNNAAVVGPPAVAAGPFYGYYGLFWINAPEKTGTVKTGYPRVVCRQLPSSEKDVHAFGGTIYQEQTRWQFKVFSNGLLAAANAVDNVINVYDNRTALGALFTTDDLNIWRRQYAPMLDKEMVYDSDGNAIYSYTVEYTAGIRTSSTNVT